MWRAPKGHGFPIGATLAFAVGVVGCSSPPPATLPHPPGTLPPLTAQVSIDGTDVGMAHAVTCQQVGWVWTIRLGDDTGGITAVVHTGSGPLIAESVRIHDLDGFTGSYWEGNHGTAEASILVTTWTIRGAVDGFNVDTSAIAPATRHFTITVNC